MLSFLILCYQTLIPEEGYFPGLRRTSTDYADYADSKSRGWLRTNSDPGGKFLRTTGDAVWNTTNAVGGLLIHGLQQLAI